MSILPWCKVRRSHITSQSEAEKERSLRPGIALALSGGGFRATLFHLGTLWRLNELGYLRRINRITSVSGGSIISGVLATRWDELKFDEHGKASNFEAVVADAVRRFCNRRLDIPAGILALLTWPNWPWSSISWSLEGMPAVAVKRHSPKSSTSWSLEGTAALTNGLAGSSAETVAGETGNNVAVMSMAPTARPPNIFTENLLAMLRVILIFSFPVVFVEVMVFTSGAFEVSLLKFSGAL